MKATDFHAQKIARELNLDTSGDCLSRITSYAVAEIDRLTEPFDDIQTLGHLLRFTASRLGVNLIFLHSEEQIEELSDEYGRGLKLNLQKELIRGDTEGLLLCHPRTDKSDHKYLAVVDARGPNLYRAYYSAWHELSHVVATPHLLENGVQRTPPRQQRLDEPVERIVERVASRLAFYRPIFEPVLREEIQHEQTLSFEVIRRAARKAAGEVDECPPPSLYATAVASIRHVNVPVCFLTVEPGLKTEEEAQIRSGQMELPGLETPQPEPKPRVNVIEKNEEAKSTFEIYPNMRVPEDSVLYKASEDAVVPDDLFGKEDQNDWETSDGGPLSPLPLTVHATRRGNRTYGLLIVDIER